MPPVFITDLEVLFIVVQSDPKIPQGSSFVHEIVDESREERIVLLRDIEYIDYINFEEKIFTYI